MRLLSREPVRALSVRMDVPLVGLSVGFSCAHVELWNAPAAEERDRCSFCAPFSAVAFARAMCGVSAPSVANVLVAGGGHLHRALVSEIRTFNERPLKTDVRVFEIRERCLATFSCGGVLQVVLNCERGSR